VSIGVKQDGERLLIIVQDPGAGMPGTVLEKLMQLKLIRSQGEASTRFPAAYRLPEENL
jgi:hypothetical protein